MTKGSARLLVALTAEESSLGLLDVCSGLAAALGRELVGLVVADPDLADAAALPFTRLQPLRGLGPEEFSTAATNRALRAFARHAEQRLASACARLEVRWSMSVIPAEPTQATAGETDLLVVGPRMPRTLGAMAAACPILILRRTGRSVVAVHEWGSDVLRLGALVATRERLPLVIVATGTGPEEASRNAADAAAASDALGLPGTQIVELVAADSSALADLVAEHAPLAVCLDPCSDPGRLIAMLRRLGEARRARLP